MMRGFITPSTLAIAAVMSASAATWWTTRAYYKARFEAVQAESYKQGAEAASKTLDRERLNHATAIEEASRAIIRLQADQAKTLRKQQELANATQNISECVLSDDAVSVLNRALDGDARTEDSPAKR
jgi:hypothetical protein